MTSLTKRQKEMILIFLSSIFFLALSAYTYFNVYAPVKEQNEQVKNMLSSEREVLFALRKQQAASGQTDTSSSQSLQRKVPVKPLEEAVLLEITKAEIKSESAVHDIRFTPEEFVPTNASEQVERAHRLSTEVHLEADSYLEVERFIEEIEQMDRILIVDAIHFTAPEEVRDESTNEDSMQMTITFSAFYRPDLVDLQREVPKIDAPPSEGKYDPTPFNEGIKRGTDS
ncbi:pilus assembly protein PilO [Sporosarcina sp. ACRSM]|uniref:pilus assembly protein PilO n=1 Tax=Sporosarcina sp. ACRSM TaxID=2918216 RepID=UPI001EF681BA|nr:pilus assembly protein PilO [Sporosarcina sp. ACRSM]MCG7336983.1 pilus assembly protein PilO [Sporosarcina sp. ACRSM]